jgi:hypothetical protein
MDMRNDVAPRTATTPESIQRRREGRHAHRRSGFAIAAAAGLALAAALTGCAPGASSVPLPSVALPSIDASAAASAGAQAALAALDQVDAAITTNTTPNGLTADEATALKNLTADLRTKLTSGDMPSAKTAFDAVSAKVDELSAKLNSDTGKQLKDAVASLRALIPAS